MIHSVNTNFIAQILTLPSKAFKRISVCSATISVVGLTLGLAGCDNSTPTPPASAISPIKQLPTPLTTEGMEEFRNGLLNMSDRQLLAAFDSSKELQQITNEFLAAPSTELLNQTRVAWRAAYSEYLRSLPMLQLPISEPSDWYKQGLTRQQLSKQLNSWPIEPGYIDYIDDYPLTGIVNDDTVVLSQQAIADQHQFSDETYVSIGFHAIEFLLWGEHGNRSADDFNPAATQSAAPQENTNKTDSKQIKPSHYNQKRRGDYLRLITELLVQHMQRLQLRWDIENGYYAEQLSQIAPGKVLYATLLTQDRIIGQGLIARYSQNDSSPFSKTSRQDTKAILDGIRVLLLPKNSQQDALWPLISTDVDKANALDSALENALTCAQAEGKDCQQDLVKLQRSLREAASVLGIRLTAGQ
ncbi:MAG: imelysin family protein [Oleibacter sp.]|nr:imelysin family protein [Thalassolituus sp.]